MDCRPAPTGYPVIRNNTEFEEWISSARPGSWCAYRVVSTSDDPYAEMFRSRVRMGKAMYAHDTGIAILAQRRIDAGTIHYLAKRVLKTS